MQLFYTVADNQSPLISQSPNVFDQRLRFGLRRAIIITSEIDFFIFFPRLLGTAKILAILNEIKNFGDHQNLRSTECLLNMIFTFSIATIALPAPPWHCIVLFFCFFTAQAGLKQAAFFLWDRPGTDKLPKTGQNGGVVAISHYSSLTWPIRWFITWSCRYLCVRSQYDIIIIITLRVHSRLSDRTYPTVDKPAMHQAPVAKFPFRCFLYLVLVFTILHQTRTPVLTRDTTK